MEFLTLRRWTSSSLPRATCAFGWFEILRASPHPSDVLFLHLKKVLFFSPIHNEISLNSSWCHTTLPSETFLKGKGSLSILWGSHHSWGRFFSNSSPSLSLRKPWTKVRPTPDCACAPAAGFPAHVVLVAGFPAHAGAAATRLVRGNSFFIKRERD